jgi:hypothetical protein
MLLAICEETDSTSEVPAIIEGSPAAGLVAVPDPPALELGVVPVLGVLAVPVLGVLAVPPSLALVDAEPAADFRTNTFGSVRTTPFPGKYV